MKIYVNISVFLFVEKIAGKLAYLFNCSYTNAAKEAIVYEIPSFRHRQRER